MPTRLFRGAEGERLLDIVSYGRRGLARTDRFSPAQLELISRTARGVPEVMVKVSGGGTSTKAVAAHFRYIDRRGQLEIETDEGEQIRGKVAAKQLLDSWDMDTSAAESQRPYSGAPGRRTVKLVHNIVLSMPAGTPSAKLLAASRAFAREEFGSKFRYAMVLHTDQDHPHVHLVVKAISEDGKRLRIQKATLRHWRCEFAHHLRVHGVAANATDRAIRGRTNVPLKDGIYQAARRGASTHVRKRAESVASDLLAPQFRREPGSSKLLGIRSDMETGWRVIADLLTGTGDAELAAQIRSFVQRMPQPMTDRERVAEALMENMRQQRLQRFEPTR